MPLSAGAPSCRPPGPDTRTRADGRRLAVNDRELVFDIGADDAEGLQQKRSVMKWDMKTKKYALMQTSQDGKVRRARSAPPVRVADVWALGRSRRRCATRAGRRSRAATRPAGAPAPPALCRVRADGRAATSSGRSRRIGSFPRRARWRTPSSRPTAVRSPAARCAARPASIAVLC
jgi:hypothetical protein